MSAMTFSIRDKRISPSTLSKIGEGGEGTVYDLGSNVPGFALKVLKRPAQFRKEGRRVVDAAFKRRRQLLKKLEAMPTLPRRVVAPEGVITDRRGLIAALVLPKVQGGFALSEIVERAKRISRGISLRGISQILTDLHETIVELHAKEILIGDFKPDNILVCHRAAFLVDSESFQYREFAATGFTEEYLDPLIYQRDAKTEEISELAAFTKDSDWFAFAAIAMQLLLGVLPYGGSHLPRSGRSFTQIERPKRGISIFSEGVVLAPKAAPPGILPAGLAKTFADYFSHARRGVFPIQQIADAEWIVCEKCTLEHGCVTCPACKS